MQEVLGSILHWVVFLSYYHLLQLEHLLSAVSKHLLTVGNAELHNTFFPCGQSTFMQCFTVALHKRLLSALVHAGAIYQTKARFFLYPLIFRNENCLVNCINKEIQTDFFTFIFCANTAYLIFHPRQ